MREKTGISKAGSLNNPAARGYTLVEVVVVIAVISILLYVTVPMFNRFLPGDQGGSRISRLVVLIQSLKQNARSENRDYLLHMDPGMSRVWVTHEQMDDQEAGEAMVTSTFSFSGLVFEDLEFPGDRQAQGQTIRFYKGGWSDMALIHLREGDRLLTLKLEPFLIEVEQVQGRVSYQDCM